MSQSGFISSGHAQATLFFFIVLELRLLVWRNPFYLDSLNINDLPGHFISTQVPRQFEY